MNNLEETTEIGVYKTPTIFNNVAKPTESTPYFWINKATWTESYKDFIKQTILKSDSGVMIAIDGVKDGEQHTYVMVFQSVGEFEENYLTIENLSDERNVLPSKELIHNLVKECLENGIDIIDVELYNGELGYQIDGFSKSGTAFLYTDGDKLFLKTRYNQIDEIECFEDIASIAYEWNEGYCSRDPFGWDKRWVNVFKNFGWMKTINYDN